MRNLTLLVSQLMIFSNIKRTTFHFELIFGKLNLSRVINDYL